MRGRGRGRGGRGGRGSITHDLLKDNLEDLGIDLYSFRGVDTPDPLFPTISLRPNSKLDPVDQYLVQKSREISHRLKSSPYYLRRTEIENSDIKRYSDKYRKKSAEVNLLDCINTINDNRSSFVPDELLDGSVLGKRGSALASDTLDHISHLQRKRRDDVDLQKLEKQEKEGIKEKQDKPGVGSDSEVEDDIDAESEDDYGVDHYASDGNEGYDSGEAEATF